MARQPELPSHQPDPELQKGELRIPESVRSAVHISYEPRLAQDGHLVEYSNLEVHYQELTVRPGRRGNVVIGKTKPDILRVDGAFATLDVAAVEGEHDVYALELHLDADALAKGGLDQYKALPSGFTYAKPDKLDETRQEGALTGYLQSRIPNNFEVDVLEAVMGDNREAWGYREVERDGVKSNILPTPEQQVTNERALLQELQTKLTSLRTIHDTIGYRETIGKDVRRLNAPIVRSAMQRLQTTKPIQ